MPHILLATALVLALAFTATAEHCTTWSTSAPEITFDPYYVDHDICQPDCWNALNIYEESNGFDGLQRSDEMVDDTCHGAIASDRLIEQIIY